MLICWRRCIFLLACLVRSGAAAAAAASDVRVSSSLASPLMLPFITNLLCSVICSSAPSICESLQRTSLGLFEAEHCANEYFINIHVYYIGW